MELDNAALKQQLLYYFSPANLNKDSFFKKQQELRNDGGLPIDILLKCNKLIDMKVTKEALIDCANNSKKFTISADGVAIICSKKFKVPEIDKQFRTLVVCDIPRASNELAPHEYKCSLIEKLKEYFKQYGSILSVNIPSYKTSNHVRGFAFIEFKSDQPVKDVISEAYGRCDFSNKIDLEFIGDSYTEKILQSLPSTFFTAKQATKGNILDSVKHERKHIWRHCSKNSHQIIAKFNRMRNLGYSKRNPMQHEFAVITDMPDPCEEDKIVTAGKVANLYGEFSIDTVTMFPQNVWNLYHDLFYKWQTSWLERFQRKVKSLEALKVRKEERLNQQANGVLVEASQINAVEKEKLVLPKHIKFDDLPDGEEVENFIKPIQMKNSKDEGKKEIQFQPGSILEIILRAAPSTMRSMKKAYNHREWAKNLKEALGESGGLQHFDQESDHSLLRDLGLCARGSKRDYAAADILGVFFARFQRENEAHEHLTATITEDKLRTWCGCAMESFVDTPVSVSTRVLSTTEEENVFREYINRTQENMRLKRKKYRRKKRDASKQCA